MSRLVSPGARASVGPSPSQNRACAIDAHGSPNKHLQPQWYKAAMRRSFVLTRSRYCARACLSLLARPFARLLLSSRITRLHQYYESIRLAGAFCLPPFVRLFGILGRLSAHPALAVGWLPCRQERQGSPGLPTSLFVTPRWLRQTRLFACIVLPSDDLKPSVHLT